MTLITVIHYIHLANQKFLWYSIIYLLRKNLVIICYELKIFGKSISRALLSLLDTINIYCLTLKGYLLILYKYFNR